MHGKNLNEYCNYKRSLAEANSHDEQNKEE